MRRWSRYHDDNEDKRTLIFTNKQTQIQTNTLPNKQANDYEKYDARWRYQTRRRRWLPDVLPRRANLSEVPLSDVERLLQHVDVVRQFLCGNKNNQPVEAWCSCVDTRSSKRNSSCCYCCYLVLLQAGATLALPSSWPRKVFQRS